MWDRGLFQQPVSISSKYFRIFFLHHSLKLYKKYRVERRSLDEQKIRYYQLVNCYLRHRYPSLGMSAPNRQSETT